MTMTTDNTPLSAVNALIGWYAQNVPALQVLAAEQGITLDELVPRILNEAMAANGLAMVEVSPEIEPGVLQVQDIRLETGSRRIWQDGKEIDLPRLQFDVLALLMRRAGHVVRRREVATEVWEDYHGTVTKSMDMHISWIRKALGDDPKGPGHCRYITTVRGVGWRIERG